MCFGRPGGRRRRRGAGHPGSLPDWKSFLRLHIDEQGLLTIYPIGIQRVPRRWRAAGDPGGLDTSELLPDDPRWTPPALIEGPIPTTRGETPPEAQRRPAVPE